METTRRTLLQLLAASGTVAAVPGGPAAPPDVIMIIRHAEKPPDSGVPFGITADGVEDGSALVVRGWQRAGALIGLFTGGSAVRVPTALYAVDDGGTKHLRMAETIRPLSDRLGIPLNTDYAEGDEDSLAAEITKLSGTTLVCWEHSAIPDIVANMGGVSPEPPARWDSSRFDMVWVFTRDGAGWTFSQVPQLLLAGDSSSLIS